MEEFIVYLPITACLAVRVTAASAATALAEAQETFPEEALLDADVKRDYVMTGIAPSEDPVWKPWVERPDPDCPAFPSGDGTALALGPGGEADPA